MAHFTSKIDVRIDTNKHRIATPRTDRNRAYLTRYHWPSDVDFLCTNTAREMQPSDSGRERKQRTRGVDHHVGPDGGSDDTHVIGKRLKDRVCLLTVRETEVLLDPPDKLFDRYWILKREQPAKSASVALGFAERRNVHGIQGADMFWITSATREPIVDTAVHTIEGRVWRVNRHARCSKVEKGGLKGVRERERPNGFEDRGVVRHDKCYRGV